jgi:uncharacterized protein with HEPN domain
MKHNDIQLIKKIIAECKDIIRYTSQIDEKMFLENDIYQKATAMSLLNIGEHANSLTREIWDDYQEIEWRKIVGLRNIVAHGYGELKMKLIWNLTKNDVPLLLDQFENLIA